MALAPQLSLIIPAFNEAQGIRRTLQATQSYLDGQNCSYEIIVAADGNDGTREIVADMARSDSRLSVLGSAERGGKGRGIRQGMARAQGKIVGFADADYKTPIEELAKILPWFDQGYDVVIGSRACSESRIEVPQALYRQLGSKGFAIVMRAIVGLRGIHDTQCGFKFFRQSVARELFAQQRIDGYMFDVEILHLAERAGYRIKEVGVRWQDDGDSRLNLVAGNLRNVMDLFRIRLMSRTITPVGAPSTSASPTTTRKAA
jgi:dolichyl-phosphate beta-glucosyltransferase